MAKVRVSTTVDEDLLRRARDLNDGTDASLIEAALSAYLTAARRAEIDAAYNRAYAELPLSTADEWGDLASFHEAMDRV